MGYTKLPVSTRSSTFPRVAGAYKLLKRGRIRKKVYVYFKEIDYEPKLKEHYSLLTFRVILNAIPSIHVTIEVSVELKYLMLELIE